MDGDSPTEKLEGPATFERDPETRQFHCTLCGVRFNHKYSLLRHFRLHTGERPYECGVCGSSFVALDKLRSHERAKHPTLLPAFPCDECSGEFLTSGLLRAHKNLHLGIHECDVCGLILTKKAQLTAHKKLKHSEHKPFSCSICGKHFALKYCLRRHAKTHRNESSCNSDSDLVKTKNYLCSMCRASFVGKFALESHLKKHAQNSFECDICHLLCSSKQGLSVHISAKHSQNHNTQHVCDICGRRYSWKHAVTWHKKTVHGIKKRHRCPVCLVQFDDLAAMQDHKKIHLGKKCYKCHICEKTFFRKTALNIHLRIHTGERPFLCELCNKNFRSSASLRVHCMKGACAYSDSSEKSKRYFDFGMGKNRKDCVICHLQFKTTYLLKAHMTAHPSVKEYDTDSQHEFMCKTCRRFFATKRHKDLHKCKLVSNLSHIVESTDCNLGKKPHLITLNKDIVGFTAVPVVGKDIEIHSCDENNISLTKSSGNEYICEVCKNIFSSISDLETHKNSHGLQKQHNEKHNKVFSSKQVLNTHIESHVGKKRYQCEICGKRFFHSSTRSNHRKIHSGERPFVCETCGKSFITKSGLDIHRRIHTGERPYRCEVCDRTFSQISTRNSHRKTHSGIRPFECNICGRKYLEKRALNAHSKLH